MHGLARALRRQAGTGEASSICWRPGAAVHDRSTFALVAIEEGLEVSVVAFSEGVPRLSETFSFAYGPLDQPHNLVPLMRRHSSPLSLVEGVMLRFDRAPFKKNHALLIDGVQGGEVMASLDPHLCEVTVRRGPAASSLF